MSWFESAREFVHRHRRKLIVAGVVTGVAAVGYQIVSSFRATQERNLQSLETKLLRRTRVHKFFEQSQETSQAYIRAMLPQLHERVGLALELPSPLELRNATASKERKYELWNQMKFSGNERVSVTFRLTRAT